MHAADRYTAVRSIEIIPEPPARIVTVHSVHYDDLNGCEITRTDPICAGEAVTHCVQPLRSNKVLQFTEATGVFP
jgi:hypothetical protein